VEAGANSSAIGGGGGMILKGSLGRTSFWIHSRKQVCLKAHKSACSELNEVRQVCWWNFKNG